jgi:dynein heavy chain
MWKAYTLCVDKMIVEGFNTIIQTSLNYFLKETDHIKFEPDPLFEIQLRLDQPELLFTPSMEIEEPESFYLIIQDLIQSVYKQASLIQRIAKHIGANDYQVRHLNSQ